MSSSKIHPYLVYADKKGNIYDHPELLMLSRKKGEFQPPRPDELIPLPEGSDVFFLPKRNALGFDPETGKIIELDHYPVAAFVCPGYTLTGICAFSSQEEIPPLPLYAYGALGYHQGQFWVMAN